MEDEAKTKDDGPKKLAADKQDSRPAPRSPTPRRRSGFGRFLLLLMFLTVGIGGAYATFPVWWPEVEPHLPPMLRDPLNHTRVVGLADRIRILEEQAKAREARGDPVQDLEAERERFSQELGKVMARLESVEDALGRVRGRIDQTAGSVEMAGAREALQKLSERLLDLESSDRDVAEMMDRIRRLEESVTLRERLPEAERDDHLPLGLAESIADIARRVGALEETRPTVNGDGRAFLLAVVRLQDILRAGRPYGGELETLRILAQGGREADEALAVLGDSAAEGLPSTETLRQRFNDVARRLTQRGNAGTASQGWVGRTIDNLGALVTVRREGGVAAGGQDDARRSVLSLAEAALGRDDLAGAVGALQALEGDDIEAFAGWVRDARKRYAADEALAVLHALAISDNSGDDEQGQGN